MPTLKFTPREAEALLHRLTLSDCISEALTDYDPEHDPAPLFSKAEVEAAAERLERELSTKGTLTIETALDHAVLDDAVDGNTWGYGLDDAVSNGEMTPREAAGWRTTLRRLSDKMQKEFGLLSRFPL